MRGAQLLVRILGKEQTGQLGRHVHQLAGCGVPRALRGWCRLVSDGLFSLALDMDHLLGLSSLGGTALAGLPFVVAMFLAWVIDLELWLGLLGRTPWPWLANLFS